jgi:cell division septum initiation protein DivIVA
VEERQEICKLTVNEKTKVEEFLDMVEDGYPAVYNEDSEDSE